MKTYLATLLVLVAIGSANGQIRLVEVVPSTDHITIKNFGASTVDISSYRLCALIVYTPGGGLSSLTVESGSLNLGAGQSVTVSGWPITDAASDLGLYLPTGGFGSAANMVDFTQWGAGGQGRESVAVAKMIWTAGEFLDGNEPYTYIGDGTQNGLAFWQSAPNTETDITTYSFEEETMQVFPDNMNHTVDIEVEFGTDLSNLVASFDLSEGATAAIGAVPQTSGLTANDFTSPLIYTITAEDGATTQDWTVTATEALNVETDILSFSFAEETGPAVIGANDIDVEVNAMADLSNLIASFTLSEGATATIAAVNQMSGVTPNDFTTNVTYTITAQDGVTTSDWTVTVTQEVPPNTETDFLSYSFSEQTGSAIIDAVAHSIQVEVEAGTDASALIASFTLSQGATTEVASMPQQSGVTPNNFTSPVDYKIIAEDGITMQDWQVIVTVKPFEGAEITSFSIPTETKPAVINTGAQTISVEMPEGTDFTNLIATFELSDGATAFVEGVEQTSGVTMNDFTLPVTYTVHAEDGTVTPEEWLVTAILDPQTDFLTYGFMGIDDETSVNMLSHKINVTVPRETDLTMLIAEFTLSAGATVEINGSAQVSGVTENDFSSEVIYTITSQNGLSTQDWSVNVEEEKLMETDILAFSIPEQSGSADIDENDHFIEVLVPFGTDVTVLVPSFTLSEGAAAKIGSDPQISGESVVDFTEEVTYLVVAEDGVTMQEWEIEVSIGQNNEAEILEFILEEQVGQTTIDAAQNTIVLQVEFGTDLGMLVPEFGLSQGAVADIGGAAQESGESIVDFTNPVIYTITAEDQATTKDWTITIEIAPNTATEILSFSLQVTNEIVSINLENNIIDIVVPFGTDVTQLTPVFELSEGATAFVNGFDQISGISHNDYSGIVIYNIVAEDGTTSQDWSVCTTITPNSATDFISFSIPSEVEEATIDSENHTINVTVMDGTDLTNLIATYTLSEGAVANVEGTEQISGTTANEFTNPLTYTIAAEDGVTVQDWIVTIDVEVVSSLKDLRKQGISVYPNPTRNELIVQNSGTEIITSIRLLDPAGKLWMELKPDFEVTKLDLNKVTEGLYFVQLQLNDGRILTSKILKK